MDDLDKKFNEFIQVASKHYGQTSAHEHAITQRDKALETVLIKRGLISKQELDTETIKNLDEVIEYIKSRKMNIKSPIQKEDFEN